MHNQIQQPTEVPGHAICAATGHSDLINLTATRMAVCAEALTWLGTPYHHYQRIKGHGVDCVHFLCAVYEAVGILPPTDPGHYPQFWHQHRNDEVYADHLDAQFGRTSGPLPGDVVLFQFGRTHSHSGIVLPDGWVVHAQARAGGTGSVMCTRMSEGLHKRKPWFWSIDKAKR